MQFTIYSIYSFHSRARTKMVETEQGIVAIVIVLITTAPQATTERRKNKHKQ
jgi:hypothetical protein